VADAFDFTVVEVTPVIGPDVGNNGPVAGAVVPLGVWGTEEFGDVVLFGETEEVGADVGAEVGADVGAGTAVSIVTDDALRAAVGPVVEAELTTELGARRAITVPSDEHTTDTVIAAEAAADGVKTQPVAVPVFEKSPAAIPDTGSVKASMYDNVRDEDGEDGAVHVASGTAELINIVVATSALTGPLFKDKSATAFEASRAITVPSDEHTTDTVMEGDAEPAEGVKTQPVAVPVLEKSPAAMPETLSEKVNVYDNVRDPVGDDGTVHEAVGAMVS
jgi:hypothetical protein